MCWRLNQESFTVFSSEHSLEMLDISSCKKDKIIFDLTQKDWENYISLLNELIVESKGRYRAKLERKWILRVI